MKINFCLFLICALAASCTGSGKGDADTVSTKPTHEDTVQANANNAPAVNMQYCFYHTDGTAAQDTTAVSITINGDKVTGKMNWIPKEKDARKGKLAGKLTGNAIKAVWSYGQEGTKDTMSVEFQLRGNALAQKPYKYDSKTGAQQTNSAADYSVIYTMKNCVN